MIDYALLLQLKDIYVPVSVHDADSATEKEYMLHLARRNLNDELKSIIVTTSGGDSDNPVYLSSHSRLLMWFLYMRLLYKPVH